MGQVSANGIDITYTVHGEGGRGTVLLICGTGQPASMWEVVGTLGGLTDAGYQVVTFDNRGMAGAACPAPPWTADDMANDAAAVLKAIGPAHVMGVSLGALLTQTLALRHPDLVRTATLMVGGGQFSPTWQRAMSGLLELLDAGVKIPKGLEDFVMLNSLLTPAQQADPAMVDLATAIAGGLVESFGPGGQHGQYAADVSWMLTDHVAELATVQPPVLVIANEHDPCFPAAGQRAVAAAVPNGTYVEIPGVSHVSLDPDSLQAGMDALMPFLAAHS